MAKFKLKGYSGAETVYDADQVLFNPVEGDVKVPFSYGEAIENVPISLDFSAGVDQRVISPDGYLVKSAVIPKPADLVAENIKRGKVIAGIEGDFVGDTEEITVDGDNDLTFAGGDFVVEPSSAEKVISKVTISPPSALVPENIAKDVTIAGVTGTHEGGGGGGGDIVAEKDVKFYDYDGTLLHEYTIAEANALSELPALPTHDGLICQGWNYSLDDIKNTTRPVDVGAIYITDDGKTRVHIEYDSTKAVALTFYWKQTVANGVLIDWGDGSGITSVSGTGAVKASHTYQSVGDYVATFDVVDGCTFSLGQDSQTYAFCGSNAAEKSFVKSIHIGGGSVELSSYAIYNVYTLQSITIPNTITSIGRNAFSSCNLSHVTIPNTVTSIGDAIVSGCKALTSVSIPNSVTSTATYMFSGCFALKNVSIPNGVTSIGTHMFYDCHSLKNVSIPIGITSIGNYTFYYCYSLENVSIPIGVTSIGDSAFQSCHSLKKIIIPDTVTSIGSKAFQYCYALASASIPDSVTSIGSNAFQSCYALSSVTIPNGLASIGSYVFNGCRALSNVTIPNSVTSIGNYAFRGCYALASVIIPESVTSIGTYAFADCNALLNVSIPDGVTKIPDYAFYSCYNLTSVNIPDGVTSIGTYAFYGCYCLSSVTIPNTVTSIGNFAFSCCYGFVTFDFSHFTAIPTLGGTSAFDKSNWLTIKVPSALLSSWKTASNWSSYASYMVGV